MEIEIVEFPNNSKSNRVIIALHLSFSHYAVSTQHKKTKLTAVVSFQKVTDVCSVFKIHPQYSHTSSNLLI